MSNIVQNPPFLFTYWNPFAKDSDLVGNWFNYVRDTSIAKYTADTVGLYLQHASADQISAIDFTGRKICGALYEGFADLQNQLSQVTTVIQGVNQRLDLVLDEARTSNLLLENVAELLRIPDSQKQRQHHIEMALKFLKNARKDEDLYQDALRELLEAEKLMPSDYFVLHRIGMIYLYVPALGNLDKALDYFMRAGKYAFVESQPDAARISNVLNKKVDKRFTEQPELASAEINLLAAESYFEAATALYALSRFEEATKWVEKAIKSSPKEAKYYFFLAKYLARSGKSDLAVPQLQKAIEISPDMALATLGDFDLNRIQPVLDLLLELDNKVNVELQHCIDVFKQWPSREWDEYYQKKLNKAQTALEKGNYFEKSLFLADFKKNRHEKYLAVAIKLDAISKYGISFETGYATFFLENYFGMRRDHSLDEARSLGKKRTEWVGAKLNQRLRCIVNIPEQERSIEETILLATFEENILWEVECADDVFSGAAIGFNGIVYVIGIKSTMLFAFDSKTGEKRWESLLGGVNVLPPYPVIGIDGIVYVGSCDDKLYAFDGQTGKFIWVFNVGGKAKSTPAIGADGTVFVGSSENKLYALNGQTGKIIWEFTTGGEINSSPSVGTEGTVYVGSCDKIIYALNGRTGQMLWKFLTGGAIVSAPAIGVDGTVFVGSTDKKIYALNGRTGEKLWEFVTGGEVKSCPAISANGTVYVGSCDYKLYILNVQTGGENWELDDRGVNGACGYVIETKVGCDDVIFLDHVNVCSSVWSSQEHHPVFTARIVSGSSNVRGSYVMPYTTETLDNNPKSWPMLGIKHLGCCQPVIGADGTIYNAFGPNFYAFRLDRDDTTNDSPWPMNGQNAQRTSCSVKPSFVAAKLDSKLPILPEDVKEEIAWHLAKAKAAEEVENAKVFRKKDFSRVRNLYSKAAALGSEAAVKKMKSLPS